MNITQELIKKQVQTAYLKGYLEIIDHRSNTISLENGVFSINGIQQIKTLETIQYFFLEAFRLSRKINIDNTIYTRTLSKWNTQK